MKIRTFVKNKILNFWVKITARLRRKLPHELTRAETMKIKIQADIDDMMRMIREREK